MKKIIIITSSIVLAIVLAVSAVILFVPHLSSYDKTITATKYDANGVEIDTVNIRVSGLCRKSFRENEMLTIQVGAFDNMIATDHLDLSTFSTFIPGYSYYTRAICKTNIGTSGDSLTSKTYSYTLILTEDHNHFLIKVSSDESTVYYAGVIRKNAKSSEILAKMLDQEVNGYRIN